MSFPAVFYDYGEFLTYSIIIIYITRQYLPDRIRMKSIALVPYNHIQYSRQEPIGSDLTEQTRGRKVWCFYFPEQNLPNTW